MTEDDDIPIEIVAAAKSRNLREHFPKLEARSVLADQTDALAGEDCAAVTDAGAAAHALLKKGLHGFAAAETAARRSWLPSSYRSLAGRAVAQR